MKAPTSAPPQLQASVLQSVAAAFALSNRQSVALRRVVRAAAELKFVELAFRDQYLSRGEIFHFRRLLLEREPALHLGKTCVVDGLRLTVLQLLQLQHGGAARSGVLSERTVLSFRSRAAAFFLLIQMSSEMWDLAPDGEAYHEKVLRFLAALFAKWKDLGVSHIVTIVLFSRSYAPPRNPSPPPPRPTPPPKADTPPADAPTPRTTTTATRRRPPARPPRGRGRRRRRSPPRASRRSAPPSSS